MSLPETLTDERELAPLDHEGAPDSDAADAWQESADLGPEASRAAWAEAARTRLLEVAHHYNALITHKELGADVQELTHIRTSQLPHYWMGDVLGRVSRDAHGRGEPLLSALCVGSDGSVGDRYVSAVADTTDDLTGDSDDHAAQQRLACYRYFDAVGLPADGGFATLPPQLAARRERARKARVADAPVDVCPTCNTQLPATKVCDNYCT